MSLRVTMSQAVRFGLALGALLTFALVGIAQAQDEAAPPATTVPVVAQPPAATPAPVSATMTTTTTSATSPMPPTVASSANASMTPTANATVTVSIKDFEFSPSNINVNVGDTVLWTNNGPSNHTATARDGLWDTGSLSSGQSSYYTFSTPGRYQYMCTIHPRMRGTVTVSQPGYGPNQMTQVGTTGGMSIYASPFDSGYSMGYGYAGNARTGLYGMTSMQNYYYDPTNGYYYAAAYPGYPYDLGYGLYGTLGYGSPYSPYGLYGSPYATYGNGGSGYGGGYGYPYSYYGGSPYGYGYGTSSLYSSIYGYPYSYYGLGYSPYAGYGMGYPYSYYYGPYQPYGLQYGNSYNPYGALGLYGLYGSYSNLYSPLNTPWVYSYPYSNGLGGYPYSYGLGGYPYMYPTSYPFIY